MRRLKDEPDVVKIAKDLGLGSTDPVEAILDYCRERVASWVIDFKGRLTLPRFHQLIDDQLSLHHVVVTSDQGLDELIRDRTRRGEIIFETLKEEFAGGTEAITFRLKKPGVGMRRHLAVIDGRGEQAARVYFSKRHEGSHLLSLSPMQLSFVFRRTHAMKNAAEERLMDRISGELAFYPPIFRPELERLQEGYVRPCFDLANVVRREVCPESSWTATTIAIVEQNASPALFLTARYASKTRDFGPESPSWALRVSIRGNQTAKIAGLFIPWNYRVPEGSVIYRTFHAPDGMLNMHADERLSIWTASNGSRLPDIPIHIEARKHDDQVSAIITLN